MPHDDIPRGASHSEDVPFSLYACVVRAGSTVFVQNSIKETATTYFNYFNLRFYKILLIILN